MGWFKRERSADDDWPSLGEAWQTIGRQWGFTVQERDRDSVLAYGTVAGRAVQVDIQGEQRGSEFIRGLVDQRRNRIHRRWRTALQVATSNPHGLTGTVSSAVDVRNPAWNPRVYDPAHCRVVWTEPPALAARVLTPSIHERLMALHGDTRIEILPGEVRLAEETKASLDGGYAVGCVLHQYPGPVLPLPDRALAGPRWWIGLLVDIAAALEA